MTAPGPIAGTNPYPLAYQTEQFNCAWPPSKSVLDSLNDPPDAGIAAEVSPDNVFDARDHPPVGAGGNEG